MTTHTKKGKGKGKGKKIVLEKELAAAAVGMDYGGRWLWWRALLGSGLLVAYWTARRSSGARVQLGLVQPDADTGTLQPSR